MKLAYLLIYSISKTLEIALPGYHRLYSDEQVCKNTAQRGLVVQLGNKSLEGAIGTHNEMKF
jgi:hypothetical protein